MVGVGQPATESASELGVLQVAFSGGEPTLRRDLAELIAHAADLGLYSNLITAAVLLDPTARVRFVPNANYSISDAETDINNGWIRVGGAAAAPSAFSITLVGPNTEIRLIPEPSVGILAALGALGLCFRRRR